MYKKDLTPLNSISDKNTKQNTRGMIHRTLSGLFWAFSGAGTQALLKIIVLIIMARLLTPKDFGIIGAAMIVVNLFTIFSQLGIGPAIVQCQNLEQRHLRTGFTISLLFGVLMGGFLFLLAPTINTFFRMEELKLVLRVMSLVFLLQGISIISQFLLQRELRFRLLSGIQVMSYLVYCLVAVSLGFMKFGIWALVWAYIIQQIISSAILILVQPHPKLLQFERWAFNDLIYFSGGLTLAKISNCFALQGDKLVVGRWLGADALGLYGRAYQLMVAPVTLLSQVIDKVFFPALAKIQNEPKRLITAYRRSIALTALLILPVSMTIFILAPEIIHVLLGSKWNGVVIPFQILSLSMFFRVGYNLVGSLARAKGSVYQLAWRHTVYMLLIIVGSLNGQRWGISGVAIGVVVAVTINFILLTQLSLNLIPIRWRDILIIHLPAMFMTLIICSGVLAITMVMRNLFLPEIAILFIAIFVVAVTASVILRLSPKFLLGQEGKWILQRLVEYLPKYPIFLNKKG